MTGSLQVKNNKYYLVLNCYENGKRKQKWIATDLPSKGNKRKAEALLQQELQRRRQKNGEGQSDILFSDYVRFWLEQARLRVDEVTWQGYESLAKCHVIPWFDQTGLKLQEITRAKLQAYLDEKLLHGRKRRQRRAIAQKCKNASGAPPSGAE